MKGHLGAIAIWLAILVAGYFLAGRLTAPPPVASSTASGAREIVVPVARDGHYYLEGAINGQPLRFMVDTGASYVSVDAEFARRAGLPEGIPGYFSTANGSVEGRIVKGQRVRAEIFEVSGLSVAVMPAGGKQGLLGQNFLRNFDVTQSDGRLVLRLRAAQ
jgi:aspartyl protease family protein